MMLLSRALSSTRKSIDWPEGGTTIFSGGRSSSAIGCGQSNQRRPTNTMVGEGKGGGCGGDSRREDGCQEAGLGGDGRRGGGYVITPGYIFVVSASIAADAAPNREFILSQKNKAAKQKGAEILTRGPTELNTGNQSMSLVCPPRD